jgi:hypothetical protein
LGDGGENLTMDDFVVQDESFPFLREFRDEETKEQYIFFNPIHVEENERNQKNEEIKENEGNNLSQTSTQNLPEQKQYYEYVVIRTKDMGALFKTRSVYFKKLNLIGKTPEKIESKDINLKILKQLSEEINKKIKNRELVADTIQKELKKILTRKINELSSNKKQNNSDLKNSFKISNNSSGNIFVLEKGNRTSKLFGNKNNIFFFIKLKIIINLPFIDL